MSDDLLELAKSVVAQARPGEGMEVYVTRGTDTEVRAYEGEVESLTSADSSGVGIRVLVDGPEGAGSQVGFAWAGSLEPAVIAATLDDARDNARFATPDPDVVLAVPDGVEAVELELWDDGVASTPMEKKVALAVELERATRAAPTPGSGRSPRPTTRTAGWRWRSPRPPASRRSGGARTPSSPSTPSPARGRRHRPVRGSASAAVRGSWCPTRRWTTPCSGRPA